MRTLFGLLVFGAFLAVVLVGCGLNQQQVDRIDALSKENEALYEAQKKLVVDATTGTLDPVKVAQAMADITAQVQKNLEEIKRVKSESSTTNVLGLILALFGRTALHGLAAAIPGGSVWGSVAQTGLTLLLGGSATAAKKEEDD